MEPERHEVHSKQHRALRHRGRHEPKKVDTPNAIGALPIRDWAPLAIDMLRGGPEIVGADSGRVPVLATPKEWPYSLLHIISRR
jgi:hypothetical protein